MKFYIVAVSTLFAMFWDELIISLLSIYVQKQVSYSFMVFWIIFSGIMASILISYHIDYEYRILTIVLISIGVLFSVNSYKLKKEEFRQQEIK